MLFCLEKDMLGAASLFATDCSVQMVAVLLWLSAEDDKSDIKLYFNCPGGEVSILIHHVGQFPS
jgi:ATP-dependent protease ClpP protease subunit